MTEKQYRIWLKPLVDEKGHGFDLPGGYYTHHSGVNDLIVGRGERTKALVFTKDEAIALIQDAEEYGYPCKAEPPIHFSRTY